MSARRLSELRRARYGIRRQLVVLKRAGHLLPTLHAERLASSVLRPAPGGEVPAAPRRAQEEPTGEGAGVPVG